MAARDSGSNINVGSMADQVGMPGGATYSAADAPPSESPLCKR
jgi:NADP-dependent 3-hydroxy acid dehydrogenase YdfG